MKDIRLLILLLFAPLVYGCDTLHEDAVPKNTETIQFQDNVFTMPNTSVIFDLKKSLNMSGDGTIKTKLNPSKGKLNFLDEGFLRYTPNKSFTSGSDLFILEALAANGTTLDIDSVNVSIVGDTLELPCFNGALSDYVTTLVNTPVKFNVIKNDGYCKDETTGAVVEIISQPKNGKAELSDLFEYTYSPNPGFTGVDSLIYSLELVDLDGNSHYSSAIVNINVIEAQDSCSHFSAGDDYYYLSATDSSEQLLDIISNDYYCDSTNLSIQIEKYPNYGTLRIVNDNTFKETKLGYTLDTAPAIWLDSIVYSLTDGNGNIRTATVSIEFYEQTPCELQAKNDHFIVNTDSIHHPPYDTAILDVLVNDIICGNGPLEFGISSNNNSLGDETILDNKIYYVPPAGYSGPDTVRYIICENAICDEAEVLIDNTE